MTKGELLEELRRLKVVGEWDEEGAHIDADSALLKYIGDPDIRDAFEDIDKWYA